MRRALFAILLFAMPCLAGCTMYDLMFDTFGKHYSDDGTTQSEKRWSYNDRVQSYGGSTTSY